MGKRTHNQERGDSRPKNRVMCPDCGKQKMLFETERKASDFIRWNGDSLDHSEDLRVYYCPSCCGWHISHQRHRKSYDTRTEELISAYNTDRKGGAKLDRLINFPKYADEARRIFYSLPEEVRESAFQGRFDKALRKVFENIEDPSGDLRAAVRRIWRDNLNR